MKLAEIKTVGNELLTEGVDPALVQVILKEQAAGTAQEMDVDAFLIELDQMVDRMNANASGIKEQ